MSICGGAFRSDADSCRVIHKQADRRQDRSRAFQSFADACFRPIRKPCLLYIRFIVMSQVFALLSHWGRT